MRLTGQQIRAAHVEATRSKNQEISRKLLKLLHDYEQGVYAHFNLNSPKATAQVPLIEARIQLVRLSLVDPCRAPLRHQIEKAMSVPLEMDLPVGVDPHLFTA